MPLLEMGNVDTLDQPLAPVRQLAETAEAIVPDRLAQPPLQQLIQLRDERRSSGFGRLAPAGRAFFALIHLEPPFPTPEAFRIPEAASA